MTDDKARMPGEKVEEGWGLVLSFAGLYATIEEEHAFVHGFEFREIYADMKANKMLTIERTAHVENRKVIERAAAALGWSFEATPSESSGWDCIKLVRVRPERNNPHGLKVVS